ncbi:MAG: efflux RND transporter permease subunit [Porticoccaceae bacterium]
MDKPTNKTYREERGLVPWFANNRVAANILMLFLILAGFIAASSMVTETFPTVDIKTITVTTPYPGATPHDVEEGITRRVEEAVIGIEGVKRVNSSANEGAGIVTVELEEFADEDEVLDDVKTAVDRLIDFPPQEAEETTITRNKTTGSMMSLALFGDVGEHTLHHWAEQIENELLQLQGITLVNITGGRNLELSIEVSENTLRNYGLTLADVAKQVEQFSIDVPGGTLRTPAGEILLRVQDKRYSVKEFANITIRSQLDGANLRLGDIATIRDGFEDAQLRNEYNGQPALFIEVSRSDSQDTLQMEETLKAYLGGVDLPEGLSLDISRNMSDILRDRMSLLARNAILGYVLVFISLLLFLDLKLAFWTSLGIPISFLGGLLLVSFTNTSMNMVSLFALIIVIGIVVDDAIVAGESIFNEQEKNPNNPHAVIQGISLIKAPVTIGVLTTIAAFAPLIFSTGTMGKIMKPVPIIVIAILAVSLIEAFYILPAHLAKPSRWSRGLLAKLRDRTQAGMQRFVNKQLIPAIQLALTYRYVTLAIAASTIIISVGVFQGGIVRFIFFPKVESDRITVSLTMPTGTPFETTERYARQIFEAGLAMERDALALMTEETDDDKPSQTTSSTENKTISEHRLIEAVSYTVGSQASRTGPGTSSRSANVSHLAQIRMELIPGKDRTLSARELERIWRNNTGDIPGAETVGFSSSLISSGADVSIELSHRDETTLATAAEQLKELLDDINGTYEVQDSFKLGKQEYVFELTTAGLAAGLTPLDIGQQLRRAYYGDEIHRIQRGRNELKVMVRYPENERHSISDLNKTRIRLQDNSEMDLRTAATIREQRGYSEIKRVDGRRVVTVSANVDEDITTPDDVIAVLNETALPALTADFPGLSHGLEGQSRDQREDLSTLGQNLLIALMVMFVMLASLLRSYWQPVIILSAIPFGFVGSMIGHLIMGFDISFISLFGMIALSGVVINDSVVLVDYYNHLRQDKSNSVRDTLIEAVTRRFRPILLTTMTTSLGLLPMLLETSIQARFLVPMAVSIAFGILYASIVILFLVPALILISDDFQHLAQRIFARADNQTQL